MVFLYQLGWEGEGCLHLSRAKGQEIREEGSAGRGDDRHDGFPVLLGEGRVWGKEKAHLDANRAFAGLGEGKKGEIWGPWQKRRRKAIRSGGASAFWPKHG